MEIERAGDFQALSERNALDGHAAGKHSAVGRTGQPQRAGRQPAHAFGIADARAVAARGDVVAHGTFGVVDAAGQAQRAAAGLRGQIVEIEASRVEDQIAVDGAESGGEIDDARGRVVDVNASGDARVVERSFEHGVDLRRACRGDARATSVETNRKSRAPFSRRLSARRPENCTLPCDLNVGVRCRGKPPIRSPDCRATIGNEWARSFRAARSRS